MDQPEIVRADLAGEDVVAQVGLGGEDELYVTPARTLCYRAEGLLSDESVEGYPHDAEALTISEGRRKSKITFDYGLDGEETLTLPSTRHDRALKQIVEGVLRQNRVLDEDEQIAQLFEFGELTVVVASNRVVRHIGPGIWDEDFEAYHYADVTDLNFEDGSVNTSVVLTVDGQQERFKTPNEDARAVRSALESTLLSHWDVDSIDAFRDAAAPEEPSDDADGSDDVGFGDGPDPLFADAAEPEERPGDAARAGNDGVEDGSTGSTSPGSAPGRGDAASGGGGAEPAVDVGTEPDGASSEDAVADPGRREDRQPEWDAGSASGAAASPPHTSDAGERVRQDSTGSGGEEADTAGFDGSGFEAAAPATNEQLRAEVAGLREVIEQQNEELTAQRDLLERLIEELRRGR